MREDEKEGGEQEVLGPIVHGTRSFVDKLREKLHEQLVGVNKRNSRNLVVACS